MIYCTSDNEIAFKALVERLGGNEREARYLWQINEGQFMSDGTPIPINKRVKKEIEAQVQAPVQEKKEKKKSDKLVLNKEQKEAVDAAIDWLENGDPDEFFIIEGKAGTGKSTIAREILKKFKSRSIVAGALSNKAKKVIRDSLKQNGIKAKFHSIAGMVGMRMDEHTGVFVEDPIAEVPIEDADIIVVDEASMVNEQALELLFSKKPRTSRILFLGDSGQLPPIRTLVNPYYKEKQHLFGLKSPVFEGTNKARLITRVRQGEENPILEYADHFWNNSHSDAPVKDPATERKNIITDNGALLFFNNSKDVMHSAVKLFKRAVNEKNPEIIKFITYKNDVRAQINTYIHNEIFGHDSAQYMKGEIVIFNSAHRPSNTDNSTEGQIMSIRDEVIDEWGVRYFPMVIRLPDEKAETGFSDKAIKVINREDLQKHKDKTTEMFDYAKSFPKRTPQYREALNNAWEYAERYGKIDYSYAITSHKSQGSTYDVAIVHEKDIMSVGATSNREKSESYYTGLTRPRNIAVVLTGSPVEYQNIDFADLNRRININKGLEEEVEEKSTSSSPDVEIYSGFWSREEVARQTDKVFLFGDNTDDRVNTKYIPSATQAVIRGLPNAIGIDTKKNRGTSEGTMPTPDATGEMNYFYGDEKREDVTADSTLEAIKRGERTATTRYDSDNKINYWKKLKVGDIIEWRNKEGDKVLVEVTKPLQRLTEKNLNGNEWSKLEGWTLEHYLNKVFPRINEAWQIEFKLVQPKDSSYFSDADFDQFKKQVDEAIQQAKDSGKTIVIPEDGIGTGKAMLKEKAPKLFNYLKEQLDILKGIKEKPKALSGYVNHSGGALKEKGEENRRESADLVWEDIGDQEFGVVTRSYSFPGHDNGSKKEFIVDTTKPEYADILKEADIEYSKAAKALGRAETNKAYVKNMMLRNWFQVKYSDKVFAIGNIVNNKVEGGTGYAVQMAINNNKPVVVFDQNTNEWKEWNGSEFVVTDTPQLTKNFAGIGTRKITKEGIQAVRDVYRKAAGETSGSKALEVEQGKIDFSSNKNPFGLYKQDLFSQFVNATVDIAADPYFTAFNFTRENIGAAVFLLHYGWHPRTITLLMNQPIIRAYNQSIERIKDNKNKAAVKLSYLVSETFTASRENFSFKEGLNVLETYGISIPGIKPDRITSADKNRIIDEISELYDSRTDIFSNEALLEQIKNSSKGNEFATNITQRELFAFYLKTQKQAENLRKLQSTVQMDTQKLATPIEALNAKMMRDEVLNTGMFDKESLEKIWNNSMVSAFNYGEDVEKVFKALMPTTMDEKVISLGLSLFSRLYGTDNKKRFHKIFFNDWIEFLIKNYGKIKEKNFEDYSERLIKSFKLSVQSTLADRIKDLKLNYPALFEKILLPKILYPNLSTQYLTDMKNREFQYRNVELGTGLESTSEFKNIITDEFRMLVNLTLDQAQDLLNNPSLTEKDVVGIRAFFKQLELAAFQQSGYNMSPISFFDMVPYEDILPIFKEALDTYTGIVKQDEKNKDEIIRSFERAFKRENKKFGLAGKNDFVNKESWRGKNYKDDSISFEWTELGLSKEEWEELSSEEQQKIRDCHGK